MVFAMDFSKILTFLPSESVKKVFSVGFWKPGVSGGFLGLGFLGLEGIFFGGGEAYFLVGFGSGSFFRLTPSYTSCYCREFILIPPSSTLSNLLLHGWQNCRLPFMTFDFLLFSLFFRDLIKSSLCWYLLSPALLCCVVFPPAFLALGID